MPKSTATTEVESPVEEQVHAEEMAPELRNRCEKVRKALAKSGPEDARARYQLGELVKDAMADEEKYGKKAVHQIGLSLGYDEKTLYRYSKVAKAWPLDELNELLKQPYPKIGMPLSFSHLLEIAGVEDGRKRRKYVNQVLKEGLPVRELKSRITAESAPGRKGPESNTVKTLRGMRSASKKWLAQVQAWERLLPAPNEAPPPPELRERYQETLEQQRELIARLQRVSEKLGTWLGEPPDSRERPTLEEDARDGEEAHEVEEAEFHEGAQVEEEAAEEVADEEVEEVTEEEVEEVTRGREPT
ncbi:DUF1016 family protein [Polyangium fumosum]|uniref:DUF1016 family protein n=1 Tax=Polyangium fumosum TaxID=889272 RepID=A0A4U1IUU9_9BACT|nr:DUF1016 family protein [Polyangium fumosum]TKC98149.1 DUF1016 family protein [Polyangium fumosum]